MDFRGFFPDRGHRQTQQPLQQQLANKRQERKKERNPVDKETGVENTQLLPA